MRHFSIRKCERRKKQCEYDMACKGKTIANWRESRSYREFIGMWNNTPYATTDYIVAAIMQASAALIALVALALAVLAMVK